MCVDAEQPGSNAARAPLAGGLACERCGAPFSEGRIDRRYCSARCRAAASRDRAAARVRKLEALIGELARVAGRS